jgi:hypothetical protein
LEMLLQNRSWTWQVCGATWDEWEKKPNFSSKLKPVAYATSREAYELVES